MATSTISPHPETLAGALAPVARRLTWARWARLASRGALVGAILCFVLILLAHFTRLPDAFPLSFVLVVLLIVGTGIGTALALARPATALQAARRAEAHGELKERLSSALALQDQSSTTILHSELLRLQQEDALAYARQIDPVQTVPLRWPAEAKWLLAVLVLLAALLWLPDLPMFLSPTERLERVTVQKAGEKLIRQGRLVEQQGAAQHLDQTQRAGRLMQKLGQRMASGHMDKRQALAQSASLSKQLTDAQRQAIGQQSSQSASQKDAKQSSAPLSEQQMRQMAKQMAGQSPAQAKQAAEEAQKMADEMSSSAPRTKAHAQAAADALKRGDKATAAQELKKAVDAAKRELGTQGQKSPDGQNQSQHDAQGVQNAQKAVDGERQEVARASGPQDISNKPSAPQSQGQQSQNQRDGQKASSGQPQSGQGNQSSAERGTKSGGAPGQGTKPSDNSQQRNQGSQPGGAGRPTPGGNGKASSASRPGQEASGQPGTERGAGSAQPKAPHSLNPKFTPSANPSYGKIYLGQGAAGKGKTVQSAPGQAQAQTRTVPVSSVAPQFRKGAEAAMDREDVPPAYKDGVRNYFNNLGNGLGKSK